ncbi:hypothetical protein OUZ56_016292 [Daphnia magna]|uniref:Uncharacterized protein n=1 Tax=Daphnia magna TaxID=35525 RepID=A0ABR0AQB6_9CRUS|nr:hypothetical protein OUZ56_016292 [Daphnia magna]
MEEEEENVESELREKKRKIDMEGREIEMKLRELTKKKNAEMEKKKRRICSGIESFKQLKEGNV